MNNVKVTKNIMKSYAKQNRFNLIKYSIRILKMITNQLQYNIRI